MGTQDIGLGKLTANLMWMREVLIESLRQMREQLAASGSEEGKAQVEEYTSLLREIILGMGDLIDRVQVDMATDDPELASQLRAYLARHS